MQSVCIDILRIARAISALAMSSRSACLRSKKKFGMIAKSGASIAVSNANRANRCQDDSRTARFATR
jgi:hypothetical protein